MAIASAKSVVQAVDHMIECPICTETCDSPKGLPCFHTFCLKCLENYIKAQDKKPGSKGICPLCRQQFLVPNGGIEELPGNFYIQTLVQARNPSVCSKPEVGTISKGVLCDVCAEEDDRDLSKVATSYCTNCHENMCDWCRNLHRKSKLGKSHNLMEIGNKEMEHVLMSRPTFCEQHPDKQIDLYCTDCRMLAGCGICIAYRHKAHNFVVLDKFADDFRQCLQMTVAKVITKICLYQKEKERFVTEKNTFISNGTEQETKLSKEIAELDKKLYDKKASLKKYQNTLAKDAKDFDMIEEDIDTQLVILESFKTYCQDVIDKSTVSHISLIADNVNARALELQKLKLTKAYLSVGERWLTLSKMFDSPEKDSTRDRGDKDYCALQSASEYPAGLLLIICLLYISRIIEM